MADRIILHSDLNCFYASVEVNENPKLRDQAIAVCGSTEERHGIVLTASYPAKRRGVKTGMAYWQAVRACPGLICVPPHYELYVKYSRLVRNIYLRYTDKMEPYGMDECWLDVSGSRQLHGDGTAIAEEIRKAVRDELGLTVSIGVSFNKIFAKLGSDMKKPDAVTTLPRDDWKGRIWPLPVSELLYVGPATTRKLMSRNILTIPHLRVPEPVERHRPHGNGQSHPRRHVRRGLFHGGGVGQGLQSARLRHCHYAVHGAVDMVPAHGGETECPLKRTALTAS